MSKYEELEKKIEELRDELKSLKELDFSKISDEQLINSIKHYKGKDTSACFDISCDKCPLKDLFGKCGESNALKRYQLFKAELERRENTLKDKDLVWCWHDNCEMVLRFWDAKNYLTFTRDKSRCGYSYSNYKKAKLSELPQHVQEWAKEAREKLDV